jgi:hypothetical protein
MQQALLRGGTNEGTKIRATEEPAQGGQEGGLPNKEICWTNSEGHAPLRTEAVLNFLKETGLTVAKVVVWALILAICLYD